MSNEPVPFPTATGANEDAPSTAPQQPVTTPSLLDLMQSARQLPPGTAVVACDACKQPLVVQLVLTPAGQIAFVPMCISGLCPSKQQPTARTLDIPALARSLRDLKGGLK